MKTLNYFLLLALAITLFPATSAGQKKTAGIDAITASDLESYMEFLASPLLRGRANGEPGLEIAQEYIVSEAKMIGLKPANGTSFYQPYTLTKNTMNPDKTMIKVIIGNSDTVTIKKPIYQLIPTGPADYDVSGEVIFAGYGLKQDKYGYNDFENLKAEGKILLVMAGSPTSEDGKTSLFEGIDGSSFRSIEAKLTALLFSRAKAVIIVMDPKSGFSSIDERFPGYAGELSSSKSLKGEKPRTFQMPNMPKILFADRSVADELFKGTGYTFEDLQKKIDSEVKPFTFTIPGKQVRITEAVQQGEITLNNVAAYIEGSDPILKKEYVIFSGHADHIGASGDKINAGADDDASGCAALLSMAKAFQNLQKKPLRSILFLWVSGEEIGLYGSRSYINDPLVPLENTVADLNMDMIGRIKSVADTSSENPMTGPDKVFVITCNQSKELLSIAEEVDKTTALDLDYSLSGRNHPLQLFSRSDHFNFVKKDIPVLFFTTGLHTTYHTPGDVLDRIDFNKMELVSRTMFQIGYNVANREKRIIVDNPYSKW
ncbi:MAG: M28 family peptidase [Bacteroidia bacterium]|nr:M28 family peptidase [Bacteroidia bacterium]